MKKILAGLFVASSLFAGSAFADGTAVTSGNAIGNVECELLADPVVLTLSNNVHAAYHCAKATNTISAAACHFAGSRKVGPERCVVIGTNEDSTPKYNDASCSGTGPEDTFDVTNKGKAFIGSTTGGSIGGSSLGDFCSDTSVAATIGN